MNESCHTHEWVMSLTWVSHVTHMNESCHTHEWVMSHPYDVSYVCDMTHTYMESRNANIFTYVVCVTPCTYVIYVVTHTYMWSHIHIRGHTYRKRTYSRMSYVWSYVWPRICMCGHVYDVCVTTYVLNESCHTHTTYVDMLAFVMSHTYAMSVMSHTYDVTHLRYFCEITCHTPTTFLWCHTHMGWLRSVGSIKS